MAESPLLAFRCPQELMNEITEQMTQTGQTKTEVVLEMLKNTMPSLPIVDRSKLPKVPAVYFVFTPDNKLLYIGRAKNLYNRWLQHHRYGQFIEADAMTRIAWFEIEEDESIELEETLITLLDSKLNGTKCTGEVLVTMRIESEKLKAFQEWTEKRNKSVSSFLREFIDACLAGRINEGILKEKQLDIKQLDQLVTERVDSQIDSRIERAISSLRSELQPLLDAEKEVASKVGKLIA